MVIILTGCTIAMISFGPRSALGFFLTPLSQANHWGRDVFAFALAIQNLLWGVGQPVAGAIADRYGAPRVLTVGAVLYAAGLYLMASATTPAALTLSAGVLIGFGLSGCAFAIVVGAFGKLVPPEWRSTAFGFGTAAGSFGQFLFSPLAVALMQSLGWHATLVLFAALMIVIAPLSVVLSAPRAAGQVQGNAMPAQSIRHAMAEAFGHRSYVLLVLGFFTCGFQLAFITVHMPAYLVDRGMSSEVGGWTIATIGLFNIIGSITAGFLGDRMPKRYLLSIIYLLRSFAVLAFISFPVTPLSAVAFGAVMGLLWLSTVPPTSALVAIMFGTRWMTALFGFAFLSHQVGGFLGVWLGGIVYDRYGTYDPIWWLSIVFGLLSAIINLPIIERPVDRAALEPA